MTRVHQHEGTPLIAGQEPKETLPEQLLPSSPFHNNNNAQHRHTRTRSNSEIFIEMAMETITEVKEAIVDGIEEAKEVLQEDVSVPVQPRVEGEHNRKLSTLALAVLVFYKVSGGAFGVEPAVKAAGPFYTLLGFTIFPFLWCIPEAFITAELGSAYPEPSGAIAWVEEAFGAKASLLCGYFHWVSGATDNAIYPTLFLSYIASYLNVAFGRWIRFLFTVSITILLSVINYLGLDVVGHLSIVICVLSMSPFVVLFLCSLTKMDPSRWLQLPEEGVGVDDDDAIGFLPNPGCFGVHWRPLLNSLFWNLNSFDVGASFAGEVHDPERVFPTAMFLSVVLTVASYLVPLTAALGAVDSRQQDWKEGYFASIAVDIAGPWLGIWMVFAAAVSNIALFEAEMSGDAYQLMGMADRGLIPKLFTRRSRFATPKYGIMLNTFVIILMSTADFEELVEMLNFAYSLAFLMEFAAFVKLRIDQPDLERPYRIPLNTFGCFLFITPPCLFLVYLMLIASKLTYVYCAAMCALGLGFHTFQKIAKHYGLIDYVEEPPKRPKKKKVALQMIAEHVIA